MKVGQLLHQGQACLAHTPDAEWDARELLLCALGLPRGTLVRHLGDEVSSQDAERCLALFERRAQGEPTQYILGEAWFMGLRFSVDARVLIPRQDTELLCETALSLAGQRGYRCALDLCTGSGALAVTLAKLGGLQVTATDLSSDALCVAQENAKKNKVQITFLQGDLLEALPNGQVFDMIMCNPPYLTAQEMDELQPEVRQEPKLALLGGTDGLMFYRRLAHDAGRHLKSGGALLMEIGCAQGESVSTLFSNWKTKVLQDLNGLDRVVLAELKQKGERYGQTDGKTGGAGGAL